MNGNQLQQMRDAVQVLSNIAPEQSREMQRFSEENYGRIQLIQEETEAIIQSLDKEIEQAAGSKKFVPEELARPPKGKLSGQQLALFNGKASKNRQARSAALAHNKVIDTVIAECEHEKMTAITQATQQVTEIYQQMLDRMQAHIADMLQEATQGLGYSDSLSPEDVSSSKPKGAAAAASATVRVKPPKETVSDEMFASLVGNYESNPSQLLKNMLEHERSLMRLLGELQFSPEQLAALQKGLQHARSVVPALASAQLLDRGTPEIESGGFPQPPTVVRMMLDDFSSPALALGDIDNSFPFIPEPSSRVELLDDWPASEPGSPVVAPDGSEKRVVEVKGNMRQNAMNWKMLAVPFAMLAVAILKDPAARQGLTQGLSESIFSATKAASQNDSLGKAAPTIFSQTASQAMKSTVSAALKK